MWIDVDMEIDIQYWWKFIFFNLNWWTSAWWRDIDQYIDYVRAYISIFINFYLRWNFHTVWLFSFNSTFVEIEEDDILNQEGMRLFIQAYEAILVVWDSHLSS